MSKKFQIIVADCPFRFNDLLKMDNTKRGAEANYNTMSIDDLKSLPVKDIADPSGSLLAFWVPSSLLAEGIEIMNAWNFQLKQSWIWVKIKNEPFKELKKQINKKQINWDDINFEDFLSFGMGRLGRNAHEVVLIGTRGKIYQQLKNKSQRTVFFYKNEKHSQKPSILQDKLDLMFPTIANKIELFGRKSRDGWAVLGNQSPNSLGQDINESLQKLINL